MVTPSAGVFQQKQMKFVFAILFLGVLFFVLFRGLNYVPEILLTWFIGITGNLVVIFSHVFGINAYFSDGFLTVSGFRMNLVLACTPLHFTIILTLGMLCYPGFTLWYKLEGIVLGNLSLILVNTLRLVLLGVIGSKLPGLFDLFHNFAWQVFFILFLLFVWIVWLEKSLLSKPKMMFISLSILFSAVFIVAISFVKDYYVRFLVVAADKLYFLITSDLSFSDKLTLLSKLNSINLVYSATKVVYRNSDKLYSLDYSGDIYTAAVYLGLMTATLILSGTTGSTGHLRQARTVLGGIVFLAIVHFAIIFFMAMVLKGAGGDERLVNNVLWLVMGISTMTPLLAWYQCRKTLKSHV